MRTAHAQPSPKRLVTPSRAALLAACLCAWTSNAPGGDPELQLSKPLSLEALEATSQATSSLSSTTSPQAATAAAPLPVLAPIAVPQSPAISVTSGQQRALILAIPAQPERVSGEEPAQVTVILAPLEGTGWYEFNATPEAEMPEPVVAFEPPTARDDVAVAAQGAFDEIAIASFATAYPANLDDVPAPVALEDIPSPVALPDIPAPIASQEISAPAAPGQEVLLATAQPFAFADSARQPESVLAPLARVAPRAESVAAAPQQLANLEVPARLPGAPLPRTALAQFNAFDASRTTQRFEVSGKAALPRPLIDNALNAFLGTERSDEQLQAARDALQRAHDVNGHRVKVILGKQGERDGVARMEVRELKRYSLRIAGALRYDPVTRRNVRADTILDHDEPLASLTLSRKLSLK